VTGLQDKSPRCATLPFLAGSGGDPARPAEGGLHRTVSSKRSTPTNWLPQSHGARDYIRRPPTGQGSGGRSRPESLPDLRVRWGSLNYNGYCSSRARQADRSAIHRGPTPKSAKKLVWEIERKLAEEGAPADHLLRTRRATCLAALRQGVDDHGPTASFNGWRMEDVWLDK